MPPATPEGLKAVCQAIAGHLCRHGEEMKFVMLRQKNADRSYLRVGVKIVIQCLGRHPTDAVAGAASGSGLATQHSLCTSQEPAWINDLQGVWLENGVNRASPGKPSVD